MTTLHDMQVERYAAVASHWNEILREENRRLRAALARVVDRYIGLVNSGDCGNWNPEGEDCIIAARAALALGGKGQP